MTKIDTHIAVSKHTLAADGASGCDPEFAKNRPIARSDLRVLTPTDIIRRSVDVSDLRTPRWWVPLSRAAGVHLAAITAIGATAALSQISVSYAAVAGVACATALSVGYRGLENLVHGGSHYDICGRKGKVLGRSRASMNDCVCNMTMAIPAAQDVVNFRTGHLADHHGGFDRPRDPCRARMLQHPDVQADRLPSLRQTLLRVPAETAAFYRTVGAKPWMAARCLLWHAAVYVAPLALVFGGSVAAFAWALVMLPLFSIALPTVRCLAETGEHDYSPSSAKLSMVERTFGHDGVGNALIHPFGDALHPEHHIWPDVPQYNLAIARKRADAIGLAPEFKRRTTILGPVVTC